MTARKKDRLTRRQFISTAAGASAAMALQPPWARGLRAAGSQAGGFRFVFMPCVHLRRDLRSPEGFAAALQAVRKLKPAPDFVLTGGDMCHNMRDQTMEQSVEITDLFVKIFNEHSKLPAHHCLGNHDLAAWNKVADSAADPRYGKQLTVQKLALLQLRARVAFRGAGLHAGERAGKIHGGD